MPPPAPFPPPPPPLWRNHPHPRPHPTYVQTSVVLHPLQVLARTEVQSSSSLWARHPLGFTASLWTLSAFGLVYKLSLWARQRKANLKTYVCVLACQDIAWKRALSWHVLQWPTSLVLVTSHLRHSLNQRRWGVSVRTYGIRAAFGHVQRGGGSLRDIADPTRPIPARQPAA